MIKVYKVVTNCDGRYYSAIITPNSKYRIEYFTDKAVKAVEGTGGIFVFSSFRAASIFAATNDLFSFSIFECEVEEAKNVVFVSNIPHDEEKLDLFLSNFWNKKAGTKDFSIAIPGSFFVQSLKLGNEILCV